MTHALITAAREFINDETRRLTRGQKLRMGGIEKINLASAVLAAESPADPAGVERARGERGSLAVSLFGYCDDFDECAATVITDILHAVAERGYSPQAVLNQAAAYYAEER